MHDARYDNIVSIILAAGEGKRIGGPKALLSLEESTFLNRIIANLKSAGLARIIVVVSPQIEEKVRELSLDVDITINDKSNADMWSSLQVGIQQIGDAEGCLVIPVDHPFVMKETYLQLAEAFLQRCNRIVIPSYEKQNGHPVVLPFDWAKTLPDLSITGGLRVAIKQSGMVVERLEIDDPGVLRNINRISDLETT